MASFHRQVLPAFAAVLGATSLPAQDEVDLDAAFAAAVPEAVESRWTLIPWRESLTDALEESAWTGKPVYLYVNDGHVASGRC